MKTTKLKIKPALNYKFAGQGEPSMDVKKVYSATPAYNQPDFEKRGLIFVDLGPGSWAAPDMLLARGEYTIVNGFGQVDANQN